MIQTAWTLRLERHPSSLLLPGNPSAVRPATQLGVPLAPKRFQELHPFAAVRSRCTCRWASCRVRAPYRGELLCGSCCRLNGKSPKPMRHRRGGRSPCAWTWHLRNQGRMGAGTRGSSPNHDQRLWRPPGEISRSADSRSSPLCSCGAPRDRDQLGLLISGLPSAAADDNELSFSGIAFRERASTAPDLIVQFGGVFAAWAPA